jgi:GntR family transcriptional regulator
VPGRGGALPYVYGHPVIDFPDINPRGELHPYRQIAGVIAAAIDRGELRPGEPVPSEKDIQDMTGVGRSTVRRAVAYLRDEGIIYTVPGRGSYVAERDG